MNNYAEYLLERGEKKYRVSQIDQAIFKDFVDSYQEITTLPQALRDDLSENVDFSPLKLVKEQISAKKDTIKCLFETQDGKKIESVLMLHLKNRRTVCVSSQVGCAVNCSFCSTGKLGLTRNLTSDEIVAQVLYFAKRIAPERISNVVYMGMGEPLHNYDAVMESIYALNNQKKLGIGSRHLTISTSGIVPRIYDLKHEDIQLNLAISLHAPTQEIREKIMPITKRFPLSDLMDAIFTYQKHTGRRIFYEYVMLAGINDSLEAAEDLGSLLKGTNSHVNLIPFNQIPCSPYESSSHEQMREFQKILLKYDIPSTIRITYGEDIDGACGQLAAKET